MYTLLERTLSPSGTLVTCIVMCLREMVLWAIVRVPAAVVSNVSHSGVS